MNWQLTVVLIVALMAIAMIVVFAVLAVRLQSIVAATVCEVVSHGTAWVSILVFLLVVVPDFKEICIGFGVELGTPTLLVIAVSDFTRNYWPYVGSTMLSLLVSDATLFAQLRTQFPNRRAATAWSIVQTVALLFVVVTIALSIAVSGIKPLNDLA